MTAVGVDLGSLGLRAAWTDGTTGPCPIDRAGPESLWLAPVVGTRSVSFLTAKDLLLDGRPPTVDGTDDGIARVLAMLRESREQVAATEATAPERLVLTVPALTGTAARMNLHDLGHAAGFGDVHMLNDSVAVVMPETEEPGRPRTVLVYSMGYRATEIGLVRLARRQVRVLGHAASRAGGALFDEWVLAQWMASGGDLSRWTAEDWASCRTEAEEAKHRLASGETVRWAGHGGPAVTLAAETFREEVREQVRETLTRLDDVLHDAEMQAGEIDSVILAGGSTAIPDVAEMLRERIDVEPVRAGPARAAEGAAAYGRLLGPRASGSMHGADDEQSSTFTGARPLPLPGGAGQGQGGDPVIEAEGLAALGRTPEAVALLRGVRDRAVNALERIEASSRPADPAARKPDAPTTAAPEPRETSNEETARALRAVRRAKRTLQKGRLQDAVGESHAASAIAPNDPRVYDEMITVHLQAVARSESDEQAREWINCAQFHARGDARVMTALLDHLCARARRAAEAGDQPAARRALEECLDLDPDHEVAQALMRDLDRARAP